MPSRLLLIDSLCPQGTQFRPTCRTIRNLYSSPSAYQETTAIEPPVALSQAPPESATLHTAQTPSQQPHGRIGSRRRRAALRFAKNVPFEQLPYQCFQEARKVLLDDRKEKLTAIAYQRARIERLGAQAVDPDNTNAERIKQMRLKSLRDHLLALKIFADINDPLVKKTFEDGQGDMTRPIYRHLAQKKWQARRLPVIVQRITQMNVVPDVLQSMEPTMDVSIQFGRRKYGPGDFVPTAVSEYPPRLNVQAFEAGKRLVSIAVVDADVPNVEKDGFDYRCHYLASNIPLASTTRAFDLGSIGQDNIIQKWLPPFAQKGSPYHRLSIFILEQTSESQIDVEAAKQRLGTGHNFILRSFVDRHGLRPIGISLFRTIWDNHTDLLMAKLGVEGAGEELKRTKVEPLPYKWKPSDGKRYR